MAPYLSIFGDRCVFHSKYQTGNPSDMCKDVNIKYYSEEGSKSRKLDKIKNIFHSGKFQRWLPSFIMAINKGKVNSRQTGDKGGIANAKMYTF